jgi:hypothetical protein
MQTLRFDENWFFEHFGGFQKCYALRAFHLRSASLKEWPSAVKSAALKERPSALMSATLEKWPIGLEERFA